MKSLLIVSNPAMATRRKLRNLSLLQRERLSEETPHAGDAIVCSHGKKNHEKPAEMTGSFRKLRNGNNWLHAQPSGWVSSVPPYRRAAASTGSFLASVQPVVLTSPRGGRYFRSSVFSLD